jgi:antitoxin PrlF
MKAIVSEKGQITVPKAVRDRMGLRPGDELDVVEDHGRIVARKVSRSDPIDSVYGILELPPGGTDAFIREIRGPGPDDHGR